MRIRYGVVQDPAVHRYVTLVGLALAGETNRADLPWKFIVLDTDGVNAFAAPGGFIFVTRGLYATCATEEQLAAVLAHEVAHVTLRHGLAAIKNERLTEAFTIIGTTAVKEYSGSQLAGIAEVSVDRASGAIKVHNFWCTIDVGVPIQPDNVIAQTESSIVYGLGLALT